MKPSHRAVFALVSVCLFLSGMAGLVYEVVWARYLALFLGHTSYAVVAVLVAFMGGLALGNAWIGQRADRTRRPLALYAWLEIGVGMYALVFPHYYRLCHEVFVSVARNFQPGSGGLLALKFVFSLLTVLLPTVLMGGTLPVLTRLVTRSLGELRQKVAALYFINSGGAVAGCWLADFRWLPDLGLYATLLAAAAINLAVGALGLFVSGWMREGAGTAEVEHDQTSPAANHQAPPHEESFSAGELRLAVIAIGLSGFVAMLYQVTWTRLLALVLGSSTHAFSIMLMTFIAGITVGSYVIYRWKGLRRTLPAFGWAELALALTLAGSMALYQYLPYWFAQMATLLARQQEAYPLYESLQALICMLVMFLPTVCLGMTLPLASRAATADAAHAGRSVGRVFAVNTLGTVLGAALTGLWLMPWLGLARTIAAGAAVNALIGLALLGRCHLGRRWLGMLAVAPVCIVGAVCLAGALSSKSWQSLFIMGLWRMRAAPPTFADLQKTARQDRLLYYRDGASCTVSVQSSPQGNTNDMFLKVNGKTDASTTTDMTTQLMLGHLPMLLRPNSAEVLVIGLGSGVTAGAVACHPSLKRLDVVEISPEVVEAARFFQTYNNGVLGNPKAQVIVEDAKSFLQISGRQYDVIISEPSNPWMAGVAGVFSLEFYQNCLAHLAPDGLMVQWVQAYDISDTSLDMVLATFSQVFPCLSIWLGHSNDLLVVGSAFPSQVDLEALAGRLEHPKVKADLARVELDSVPVLLAQEVISPDSAMFLAPTNAPIHSDLFPTLEYAAQRDFFAAPAANRWRQLDETFSPRAQTLLAHYVKVHPLQEEDYEAYVRFFKAQSRPYVDLYYSLLLRWQRESPQAIEPLEHTARFDYLTPPGEFEALRLGPQQEKIVQRADRDPLLLRRYGTALMKTYREHKSFFYLPPTEELERVLQLLIQKDSDNQRVYQLFLAELAWDKGDDAGCLALGRQAFAPDLPRGSAKFALDHTAPVRVTARMAEALWREGRWAEAAQLCRETERAGYLNKKTQYHALAFEVVQRRVLASLNRPAE